MLATTVQYGSLRHCRPRAGSRRPESTTLYSSTASLVPTSTIDRCRPSLSLDGLTALQTLDLCCCEGLTSLPSLDGLMALQTLNLIGCERLPSLPDLDALRQRGVTVSGPSGAPRPPIDIWASVGSGLTDSDSD